MKILAICGSSRRGNTEAMLKRILDGAKEAGAQIELVLLREKQILTCDGCFCCEKTKTCRLSDDMRLIYPKMFNADVIVLGSPNYFNNVSGLMKNFFDRFCPFWEETLKGKKAVLVVAGAEGGKSLKTTEKALKNFCEICSIRIVGKILIKAKEANEIQKNQKVMQKCFLLGKKIAAAE
ncbi:MAG: flavodoxin family protein [Candidatus ainarchaeum sp.]|nr:flavodoxin family protein [Candidatus ainarchaeum sp.]